MIDGIRQPAKADELFLDLYLKMDKAFEEKGKSGYLTQDEINRVLIGGVRQHFDCNGEISDEDLQKTGLYKSICWIFTSPHMQTAYDFLTGRDHSRLYYLSLGAVLPEYKKERKTFGERLELFECKMRRANENNI